MLEQGVGSHKGYGISCADTLTSTTIIYIYISIYTGMRGILKRFYAVVYSFLHARDTLLGGSSGRVDGRELEGTVSGVCLSRR
jgi:hypothetical protein